MPISFMCGKCGRSYSVSSSLAGKKGRCKDCNFVFRVPSPEPEPESAPARKPRPLDIFDDLPPPRSLYEIEDEPILPRRAPAGYSSRESSSRSYSRSDVDSITKLNMYGLASFGAAFVIHLIYALTLDPALLQAGKVEFNAITGLLSLAGFGMMFIAVLIAAVKLVFAGQMPETGVLGGVAWVLSILLVGLCSLAVGLAALNAYRKGGNPRINPAAPPAVQPQFSPPPGFTPTSSELPEGFVASQGAVPPNLGPPQMDVRVVLSRGQVSQRTTSRGTPQSGVEFRVSFNIEKGRPMGEKFVLMIKTSRSQGKLTTTHLQGSGTLSGFSPIATIDDGPFEVWMELESFGGRNSRRVSESIPLQVGQPAPQSSPPNGNGQPPGNRPGNPGPMGPRGRGLRGFPGGRP